jgi:hypothetical protein
LFVKSPDFPNPGGTFGTSTGGVVLELAGSTPEEVVFFPFGLAKHGEIWKIWEIHGKFRFI